MRVLVGAPVRQRAWILPRWFNHVEAACERAGVVPDYLFVADRHDEVVGEIGAFAANSNRVCSVELVDEAGPYVERQWFDEDRIHHLVGLRNLLLTAVRGQGPDVFFSVDSDVLLHPLAIADMLEGLGRFGAVGGATFLSEHGVRVPNCAWRQGHNGFRRRPIECPGVIPVDIIMAVKAMSPAAYAVDYDFARGGEDIGWCTNASRAGVKLGWDNRHCSKHVMSRQRLDEVDARCGF